MKYLFFTRSNGDIDSMPNDPKLTTLAKRKAFIGDSGASRFQIVDASAIPKNPKWDGSKYVPDSKAIAVDTARRELTDREARTTVGHLGKVWTFSEKRLFQFGIRISIGKPVNWPTDDNEWVMLPLVDAQAIAEKVVTSQDEARIAWQMAKL